MFVISHNISSEYPALTPLSIENESFHKIMLLYTNLRKLQIYQKQQIEKNQQDAPTVIRRPAGDNWF